MDPECFEDTCLSTLRILDLPCPACVHNHSAFCPHYSAKHAVLHSSNSCFQLLMTLFPWENWSPWKRTSASSHHCISHPSRISTSYLRPLPPPVLSMPGGESLTPSLPELQAFLLYCFFFRIISISMIIYFSNINQEHLSSLIYLHDLLCHFIHTNGIFHVQPFKISVLIISLS